MNGKVFVGQKALSLTEYEKKAPISGVILWVDDENCYEAGDETGTVIEQDCPYASQQMADNLLAALQGYSYQGLEANGAKMSPIAKLGDGMTVAGLYTQLAYQNIRFSTGEVMDMAAPGSDETLHEYKTEGETTKNFNHQIAQTRSLISKTSEEILLKVENELEGLSASIDVKLDSITSQVSGLDGRVTTVEQTANGLTTTIKGLDGEVTTISQTLDGLTVTDSGGTTKIKGSVIETGSLVLTGIISWGDLDSGVQGDINEAVNTANDAYDLAYDNQLPSYIKSTYISSTEVRSPTISGGTIIGSEIYATEDGDTYAMMDGDSFMLMRTGSSQPRAVLEATDRNVTLALGTGSGTSRESGRFFVAKSYSAGTGNTGGIYLINDREEEIGIVFFEDGTIGFSADNVTGVPVRFG